MREGGPRGSLAGLELKHMTPAAVTEPTTPVDYGVYGTPARDFDPPVPVNPQPPPQRSTAAYGTGFYVSGEGYIITNRHVANKCVTMQTQDGIALSLVSYDKAADLALLRAIGKKPTSIASFRQTEAIVGVFGDIYICYSSIKSR
jgi:S1-C subfamily serine protease